MKTSKQKFPEQHSVGHLIREARRFNLICEIRAMLRKEGLIKELGNKAVALTKLRAVVE